MADDRLDDAIDAVVRAVDRIERATRRHAIVDEARAAEPDSRGGSETQAPHLDVRPPATNVAPGRDAWAPVIGGAGGGDEPTAGDGPEQRDADRPRKKDKGKKRESREVREVRDGELHELVGRIVVRTQELDDHLLAARALRDEISELVARLAAAADHRR